MRRLTVLSLVAASLILLPEPAGAQFTYTPGYFRYDATLGRYVYASRYPVVASSLRPTYSGVLGPYTASYGVPGGTVAFYNTSTYGGYGAYTGAYAYGGRPYSYYSDLGASWGAIGSGPLTYSPVPRSYLSGSVTVGPVWFPGYGVAAY